MIPAGAPTRESIEVRALIFTYPANGRRPSGSWPLTHPLEDSLKHSHLKSVNDEVSITDRLRTDIDESGEVKDAVLLLRRNQIQRLEVVQETITAENDRLARELNLAKRQMDIQAKHTDALQFQVQEMTSQLKNQEPHLRRQVDRLSAELMDARLEEDQRRQTPPEDQSTSSFGFDERTILLQQLERANEEIEKWKAEAMGRGNEAVSRVWQGSVDEAVRRERDRDAILVNTLRAEINALKAENERLKADRRGNVES